MKTFEIGPGLTCDPDRLVASRLLVQANSGGGKTRTLRRLLEQSFGRLQHLVIDPEGEYHTLREKFDYVLAAPSGGDVVAHPRTAALLAERLLQLGVSAVLDIYELNPDQRLLFVERFVNALVNAPRELWHPALIVLDEAHVYAQEGQENNCSKAVKALASRGRKRGFCLVPATQRLAKLSKDVAAECNNKLIGRCTLDVDIKRAAEELGFTTNDQKQSLRTLDPGQFYAYGPAFDVKAPVLVQVGPVNTTHAEAGQKAAPAAAPTAKIKRVLAELADIPAEAEEREKTVAELKTENKNLKAELARKPAPPTPAAVKTVEKPALTDADRALIEKFVAAIGSSRHQLLERIGQGLQSQVDHINGFVGKFLADHEDRLEQKGVKKLLEKLNGLTISPASTLSKPAHIMRTNGQAAVRPSTPQAPKPLSPRPEAAGSGQGDASVGNSGLRRILIALAQRNGLTRSQLGMRANVSSKGGSFDTYVSKGRVNGWITGTNGRFEVTEAGVTALGSYEPLPTGQALLEHYLRELGIGGSGRMLRALADAYPNTMTRDELGAAANVSPAGGSFDTYVSKLRTRELLQGERNAFRASVEFFEEA